MKVLEGGLEYFGGMKVSVDGVDYFGGMEVSSVERPVARPIDRPRHHSLVRP